MIVRIGQLEMTQIIYLFIETTWLYSKFVYSSTIFRVLSPFKFAVQQSQICKRNYNICIFKCPIRPENLLDPLIHFIFPRPPPSPFDTSASALTLSKIDMKLFFFLVHANVFLNWEHISTHFYFFLPIKRYMLSCLQDFFVS